MGLHSLMQRGRWGRFGQADAGYSHVSSTQDNTFPCTFLSARNSTIMDINSINQWQCYFMPLLPSLNTDSTLVLAWKNTEYFEILCDKWTLSTVFITNSSLIWFIHTTKHLIKHAISKSCILITWARMKLLNPFVTKLIFFLIFSLLGGYL